jgi:hypothetical protein
MLDYQVRYLGVYSTKPYSLAFGLGNKRFVLRTPSKQMDTWGFLLWIFCCLLPHNSRSFILTRLNYFVRLFDFINVFVVCFIGVWTLNYAVNS